MNVSHAVAEDNGTWTDIASLRYGPRHNRVPNTVYFRSTRGPIGGSSDHLIPLTMLTAMVRNEPVKIEGSVSHRLLSNLPQIQTLLAAFTRGHNQELAAVGFEADVVETQNWPEGRGVACFFSGGVDSTYSAIQHRDELDALVFIRGFDLDVRDEAWREMAAERARAAAAEIGLPLIEIETDMNRFIGRATSWHIGYGPALATVALLLQPMFRRVYIAGGRAYARLIDAGAHPMLDPLWGTEGLETIHDGAELERWQKLEVLADNPIAQKHLRLCFERHRAPYNCGECPKCLTTMVTLAALGALGHFQTFAGPLDFAAVANLDSGQITIRSRIEDTIALLDRPGARPMPELRQALVRSLERWVASLADPNPREPNYSVGTWRQHLWPERTRQISADV